MRVLRKLYFLFKVLSNKKKSIEELERIQSKMLRFMINYCYRKVPYYHYLWKNHRISPYDIKDVGDVKKLPIIDKSVLRENYSSFISIDFKEKLNNLWHKGSSGSTGKPVLIYYDNFAKDYLDAIYLRALMAAGYKPNKPLFYYWYKPFKFEIYNIFGLMRKIYIPHILKDNQIIELMIKYKPEYIYCYGGILFSISKKILENNISLNWIPKSIITHGELFSEKMKEVVKNAFNTENVFDQYGTSEYNRSAWECIEGNGYHVDQDSVITEILDKNYEDVDFNESGVLVLTGLINRALPLIRYKIGDIVTKNDDYRCNCGINLPNMIKHIEGREIDFINGNSTREIMNILSGIKGLSVFQIIKGSKKISLIIEPDNLVDEKVILKRMKKITNLKISIIYNEVKKTPGGKRPFISTNINPSKSKQYKESNIFVYNF
jgi:phenylacetate-CoA ligase